MNEEDRSGEAMQHREEEGMAELEDVREGQAQQATIEEPDVAALQARVMELEQQLAATRTLEQHVAETTQDLEQQFATVTQELERQLAATSQELDGVRASLGEAQRQTLEHLRRALLAENHGQVVPELIAGATAEELLASVETARSAHTRAVEAARSALQAQQVPVGNAPRGVEDLSGLTPLAKIAHGLEAAGR
jgi:hypothetical protein